MWDFQHISRCANNYTLHLVGRNETDCKYIKRPDSESILSKCCWPIPTKEHFITKYSINHISVRLC